MEKELVLIEDNLGDAFLVKEYLNNFPNNNYVYRHFISLTELINNKNNLKPDVILLDLTLPDSKGIDTFLKVKALFSNSPIIILSGIDDEETAIKAARYGAQEYLVKGKINDKMLQLSVIAAIEREKLKQQIFESEEKFRLLSENAPIYIWLTDINKNFVYANKLLLSIFDLQNEELHNKSILNFIDPLYFNDILDLYDKSYLNKKPYAVEYELILGYTIYEKAAPYYDRNGDFLGFICTGLDLSEIKQIEKERDYNQEKYKLIAENSLDVIWKMDTSFNLLYCNKAIYNFLGYTPDEILNMRLEEYATEESVLEVKKIFTNKMYIYEETKDLERLKTENLELDFITKNGEIKCGEINAGFIYDHLIEDFVIMGVTRDNTERKKMIESIERYKKNIEIINQTALSFLEYEQGNNIYKIIGENLIKLIPNSYLVISRIEGDITIVKYIAGIKENFDTLSKMLNGTVLERKTKLNEVALNRLNKGKTIKVPGGLTEISLNTLPHSVIKVLEKTFNIDSVYVCGMKKDDNLLGSAIIIMKDSYKLEDIEIIDAFMHQAALALNRIIIEDSLVQSENKLKESIEAKDMLFSIISHDLRSPFQGMLGYFDILNDSLDEISKDELQRVIGNLNVLLRNQYNLLENLLTWANVQRGKTTTNLTLINFKDIVEPILSILELNANKKGIFLERNIPPDFTFYADIDMLKSIINNLLSNSIKFTKSGGVITISALQKHDKKFIIIEDSGIGMDEDTLNGLFKVDKLRTKLGTNNERGTGLGLILCKEFIDLHKWDLQIKSIVGIGTKFTLRVEEKIY